MKKHPFPTISQANLSYLILTVIILIGSAILQKVLGIGGNTWVNEIIYILLPTIILSKSNGWSFKKIYRYNKTSKSNILKGILSGLCIWFFSAYISVATNAFLNSKFGRINLNINISKYSNTPLQAILLITAVTILAPICEETFFRGFMQRAYDTLNPKYSFIVVGLLFGIFHVSNGISSVPSATMLGIILGYLVYSTNSIFTSMSAHAANNICALVFGSLISNESFSKLPLWFNIAAFSGLLFTIIILYSLRNQNHNRDFDFDISSVEIEKHPVKNFILLLIPILILIMLGVAELVIRLSMF